MPGRNAVLFAFLLLWVEPAGAHKVKQYSLTVSVQKGLHPTKKSIETILEGASDILQRNGCNVTFKLKGPIQTFTSKPIKDAATLDAVHRVPANVKVVRKIDFCADGFHAGGYLGCAWRPKNRPRTVIVKAPVPSVGRDPILWAHEFGHTTGLPHRNDEFALMNCQIEAFHEEIDTKECRHFRAGPVHHYPPIGAACPPNTVAR
jgi:hypothetical protein